MDYLNPSGIHPERVDNYPGFDGFRGHEHAPKEQETVFNPPWNWCGEQAIGAPFDEFGMDEFEITDAGLVQPKYCPTCGQKIIGQK